MNIPTQIKQEISSALLAIQFLTILPVTKLTSNIEYKEQAVGNSLLYYPLVGLLLGLILVATSYLVDNLFSFSSSIQATILLAIWVITTGALHLDGLADSADGWLGGHGDKDRTLEIMKDSATGVAGATILVLILLLKFAVLSAIIDAQNYWLLLIAPLVARSSILALILTTNYISVDGIGQTMIENMPQQKVALLLIFLSLIPLLSGMIGLKIIAASIIVIFVIRHLTIDRLSGISGDIIGATIEILEVIILLTIV